MKLVLLLCNIVKLAFCMQLLLGYLVGLMFPEKELGVLGLSAGKKDHGTRGLWLTGVGVTQQKRDKSRWKEKP